MNRGLLPVSWFGRRWDASVCDEAPAIAAPLGETCPLCGRPIEPGDSGLVMPYSRAGEHGRRRALHLGCLGRLADILPADEMDRLLPGEAFS